MLLLLWCPFLLWPVTEHTSKCYQVLLCVVRDLFHDFRQAAEERLESKPIYTKCEHGSLIYFLSLSVYPGNFEHNPMRSYFKELIIEVFKGTKKTIGWHLPNSYRSFHIVNSLWTCCNRQTQKSEIWITYVHFNPIKLTIGTKQCVINILGISRSLYCFRKILSEFMNVILTESETHVNWNVYCFQWVQFITDTLKFY